MVSLRAIDAFLPTAFRAFLHELHEVEGRIRSRLEARGVSTDAAPLAPEALRGQLVAFLEQQRAAARMRGRDPESPAFRQGFHLMALVGDAVLGRLVWTGQPYFEAHPLSDDFPLPDGAPAAPIDQAHQLLDDVLPDLELAQVLLLRLSMDLPVDLPEVPESSPRVVEEVRRRLYRLLAERLPDFAADPERIFPDAYERRQPPGPATYLSLARGWIAALVVGVVVFLAASYQVWWEVTEGVRELVAHLLSALAQLR